MHKVVSLADARSLVADRDHALLGPAPTLTFSPDERDDAAVCIRLRPAGRGSWVGLVADKSAFTERVRMGVRPRFLAHHEAMTPTVCGAAVVRLAGRVTDQGAVEGDLESGLRSAAERLVAETPFPSHRLLVVEVRLDEMRVDEGDGPSHGAILRT